MAKKRGHAMYPAPVYVATLDDGTVQRMSFWSERNRPIDFARGRALCALVGTSRVGGRRWQTPAIAMEPLRKVVAGHVEHGGQWILDPLFAPEIATVVPTRKRVSAREALRRLIDAWETGAGWDDALEAARQAA